MIVKSFEINKIHLEKTNYYLLYGENEGLKNEILQKKILNIPSSNNYRYEEKEILDNKDTFFNSIYSKSFFEDKKTIIIKRVSDKIKDIIEEILEKNFDNLKIILIAGLLEKKSKIRSLFEKNKNTICIPFYADNAQTLMVIVNNFFREKKIPISQEITNLLVDRSRGDRQNLNNELLKIESFIKNKKKIEIGEVIKLTNLAENYNVSELTDNCLAKNTRKTINIINENKYTVDDCILIIRTLLIKSKRLMNLLEKNNNNQSIEVVISAFKPPIFWKDKEIVKQQIRNWSFENIKNLIYEINEIELIIKKNNNNSVNILLDFIITQSTKINN
jgi:DNA polymerase III subunit delta